MTLKRYEPTGDRHHFDDAGYVLANSYSRKEIPPDKVKEILSTYDGTEKLLNALIALSRDIEVQLAERKAHALEFKRRAYALGDTESMEEWYSYRSDGNKWKASARRFKEEVDKDLREVKAKLQEHKRVRHGGRSNDESNTSLRKQLHVARRLLGKLMVEKEVPELLLTTEETSYGDAPYAVVQYYAGRKGYIATLVDEGPTGEV